MMSSSQGRERPCVQKQAGEGGRSAAQRHRGPGPERGYGTGHAVQLQAMGSQEDVAVECWAAASGPRSGRSSAALIAVARCAAGLPACPGAVQFWRVGLPGQAGRLGKPCQAPEHQSARSSASVGHRCQHSHQQAGGARQHGRRQQAQRGAQLRQQADLELLQASAADGAAQAHCTLHKDFGIWAQCSLQYCCMPPPVHLLEARRTD